MNNYIRDQITQKKVILRRLIRKHNWIIRIAALLYFWNQTEWGEWSLPIEELKCNSISRAHRNEKIWKISAKILPNFAEINFDAELCKSKNIEKNTHIRNYWSKVDEWILREKNHFISVHIKKFFQEVFKFCCRNFQRKILRAKHYFDSHYLLTVQRRLQPLVS